LLLFFSTFISLYLPIYPPVYKERQESKPESNGKQKNRKQLQESKNPKIIFTCLNQKAKSNPPPSVSLSHG